MKALSIRTTIGKDHKLNISLPDDVGEGPAEVVVILNPLNEGAVDLAGRGWTKVEAADARARLKSFQNDWDAPGMEAYDAL